MQISKPLIVTAMLLTALLGGEAYAQNNREKIKLNPNYYWAENVETYFSFSEAKQAALATLVENISTTIQSSFLDSLYVNESNGKVVKGSKNVSTLKSYSNVILEDLTVIELSPEPECKVFVYVEKSKVKSIFEERKRQITDFISSGKQAEKNLQIDDALRFYYWALMLAKSLPEGVKTEFDGQQGSALTLLPVKIRSVLNGINCSVTSLEKNNYDEYTASLNFTYGGQPVATLRYRYNNGVGSVGPVTVKDGMGESVLVDMPPDGKMDINYEYRFADEAKQLLPDVFENISPVIIQEARTACKVDNAKTQHSNAKAEIMSTPTTAGISFRPEKSREVKTLKLDEVTDTKPYQEAMSAIEEAIKKKDPKFAYSYMEADCYKLFNQLLTKTGKVSLTKQRGYEFIPANGQVLGRYMYIKLKVSGGKEFMDKLVFRFSPVDHKIQSFAFGLTEKAESDIFDAAKKWSSISRFTILNFMEDYQTAFAMKQIDYIEKIFSDDALIIVGRELRRVPNKKQDAINGSLSSDKEYKFKTLKKAEYIENLKNTFATNNYVHLTLEDNTTRTLNTGGRVPDGNAFGIQIKQMYNSSKYSDRGYLTLMLRMDKEYPIIVVRYWQPEKEEMIEIGNFFSSDNFEW